MTGFTSKVKFGIIGTALGFGVQFVDLNEEQTEKLVASAENRERSRS